MSNYCQLTIVWHYSDNILTIFLRYFDIVICALYHHLRSLSSFAQKFSKPCSDQYFQLKLHKHIWTYDRNLSKSHYPQKRSQDIILGCRVGCVSWLPPCWWYFLELNPIVSHVQIEQFSAHLCQKRKKACSSNICLFSLMTCSMLVACWQHEQ